MALTPLTDASLTALLLESDPALAETLTRMLRGVPRRWSTVVAATPADAANVLEEGGCDIVLLDLGKGGAVLDMLTALRDRHPSIPIVVLAKAEDDGLTSECLWRGAQDSIPRDDLHPAVLDRTLRWAIERHALEYAHRSLIERANFGAFRSTLEGRVLWVNAGLAAMFGYGTPEEMAATIVDVGRQLYVSPARREELVGLLTEQGSVQGFRAEVRRRDDSTLWVSISARLIRDASGRVSGIEGVAEDVSAQQDALTRLGKSEARFRALFKGLPLASSAWRRQGEEFVLADYNHMLAQLAEIDLESWIGRTARELFAEVPQIADDIHACFQGQAAIERIHLGYRYCIADLVRDLRVTTTYVPPDTVLLITEDITDRRRAQVKLQQKTRLLAESQRVGHLGSWAWERTSSRFTWSAEIFRILGYAPREVEPSWQLLIDRLHPDDRDRVVALCARAPESAEAFDYDARIVRPTGEVRWIHAEATPTVSETGVVLRLFGIVQDITARKEAEKALVLVNTQLGLVLGSLPIVVYTMPLSAMHVATYVSSNVAQVTGFPARPFLEDPRFWSERIHDEDRARVFADLESLGSAGTAQIEYRWRVASGTYRWFQDTMRVVDFDRGPLVVGAWRDVTERKSTEDLQRLFVERMLGAQEAERQRLARELHDETAQTLTSLQVGLTAIESVRSLKSARSMAARLREIAGRALVDVGALSRGLHPVALDDLGLAPAIVRMVSEHTELHGMAVSVDVDQIAGVRLAPSLEVTLYRIVQEALTNVGRHSHARSARIALVAHTSFVELRIEDDGVGFDAVEIRRTSQEGLGLLGIQQRVRLLGGHVILDSSPGRGTALRVTLPFSAMKDEVSAFP